MRRLFSVLTVLFFCQAAFAGWNDAAPVDPAGRRAEGRAAILHSAALSDAARADLAAKGVVIKHALANGRYLARVREGADVAGLAIEPLTAEKKIDRSALREAASGRPYAEVNVIFHGDVAFDDARGAILEAGGTLDVFAVRYRPSQRIEAKIPPVALAALAADERVLAVAGPRRFKIATDNANVAALSHVTDVQAAPYGLTGEGVVVSLFELAEAQSTHVEFAGGRLLLDGHTSGGSSGDKRHATHVAGTIGASGVRADAKGMAPKATIHQFCVETGGNACTGDWLDLKEEALAPLGVVADNNSWGYVLGWSGTSDAPVWNDADIYWGAYDLIVGSPLDEISNDRNILFVHSAGNDGNLPPFADATFFLHKHVDERGDDIEGQFWCVSANGSGTDCPATCNGSPNPCELTIHHSQTPFDTIGVTAAAKNVIAVGAVNALANIATFSSRGPAKDGRVKPDLVARGLTVLSSVPTDTYATSSGTSMASPAVTGIAALMTEQWRKTFGGASPTPAQLKAVLIAGADDLGNPGPDYTYGFGLANAKASADLIIADEGTGKRIRNLSFANGQGATHEVAVVVPTTEKLRVVLNWPDPAIPLLPDAETDVAPKALVNDLDVKVIDPSGTTHFAYVLDKNNFENNATRGVNTVDNTEVVEIDNAAPGTYRVIATGTNVADGPQTAVLVSSARTSRPCIDIQETGNTPETAFGNLVSGGLVAGGLCSQSDVDFYRFVATKTGPVTVTVTTTDTPLRVTLTGNGISRTQDIPANQTAVLSADANVVPNAITLKIEAAGTLGAEPQYTFVAEFGEEHGPRRRSVRK
jgi:hypothetical protein